MNVVVCVKQVPDTWAEKRLLPDGRLDRDGADGVMNELDEYAIEEALRIKERRGDGTVTIFTMGPTKAAESIRKALSMGADAAVHLVDERLAGSDAVQTAHAISSALGTLEYDLVLFGAESTDARMGVLPAMVAERLGLPQLTFARKVEVANGGVRIERVTDAGYDVVEAATPAVVSVVEKINEPRYPSFKNIVAAKKKPLTTLSAADANIDPATVGGAVASTRVVDFVEAPPRGAGTIVADSGTGGVAIADFLAAQKLL